MATVWNSRSALASLNEVTGPAGQGASGCPHIAIHTGVLAEMDAISWSATLKIDVLESLLLDGHQPTWTVFCSAADPSLMGPSVKVAPTPWDVLADPDFGRACLHVYEYGIHYDLLNTAYFRPPSAGALGIFHNVTPPSLGQSPGQKWLLERSLLQVGTLAVMDHIACDSAFNRRDLVRAGIPEERTSVLSLPVRELSSQMLAAPIRDIDLLYVGRLVEPKGVGDLLNALARLEPGHEIRVVLACNPRFSDHALMQAARELSRVLSHVSIQIVEAPSDADLAELYARARIFVMPSHHEGFCVPVLEALSAGCFVVGSDAGNVPEVVGDCGLLFEAGSVDALAGVLAAVLKVPASGLDRPDGSPSLHWWQTDASAWPETVTAHLRAYSIDQFRRGLVESMAMALEGAGNTRLAQDMRRNS